MTDPEPGMPPTNPPLYRSPLLGLLVVGLGTAAASLDTSVNIAFPAITTAFGLEVRAIQWVVVSYVLTYGSLMLAFGKLGDLFGYRRVFRAGLALSALAFTACTLAPSFGWLLAGRALQGLGIALTLSCGPALATSLYPESRRTWVLGISGALMAIAVALGPLVGGLLIEQWGWASVFAFRVPIVLLALALSVVLPEASGGVGARNFDALGAVLLAVSISALLLSLAVLQWGMPWHLAGGLGAAALIGFSAFIVRQLGVAEPIIRLAPFRDAAFSVLHVASIVVNAAAFAMLLLAPYYLSKIAGMPLVWAGVMLSLSAVGGTIGSFAAGRIASLIGSRHMALLGMLTCAAGLIGIGHWDGATHPALQAPALLTHGLGLALFHVAYTDIVTATLPVADRGVAGSLSNVTRTIGIVSGATGLSAVFRAFQGEAAASALVRPETFLPAFQSTFLAAGLGVIGFTALSFLWPRIWLARGP